MTTQQHDDVRVVSSVEALKAMGHPLRQILLDLALERPATVREFAQAVGRPPSTVAYHVGVLVDAELFEVVATRRVRAVDERFYARTAPVFLVGELPRDVEPDAENNPIVASGPGATAAHAEDDLRAILRHARIPRDAAADFWDQLLVLVARFGELPRAGDQTFAFVAGLYPTAHPTLPPSQASDGDHRSDGSRH